MSGLGEFMDGLEKVDTILGPPGTGKTTTIIGRIESLIAQGVRPAEIAFVSFTKSAIRTAVDRAAEKFDVDPEEFAYFRTIHSMAYKAMRQRVQVMEDQDWKDFGESCVYSFSDTDNDSMDGILNYSQDGDVLRSIDAMARVTRSSVAEAMLRIGDDIPPHIAEWTVHLFRRRISAWKSEKQKIDFVDMLEKALVSDWVPPVRFAFADEFQDNTRLQNSLLRKWFIENPRCGQLTAAGDDDQGIHRWNGAEKSDLLWLARHTKREILSQSYRIPASVHGMAQSVIRQNKDRIDKVYRPRSEEGSVRFVETPDRAVDAIGDGSSFVLVRNKYLATPVIESCLYSG